MEPLSPKTSIEAIPDWNLDLLARTINAAGQAFYFWDIPSGRLEWSAGAADVLGVTDEDMPRLAAEMQLRVAPDDLPVRAIALSRLLEDGTAYGCEFKLRRSDGGFEWISERGSIELNAEGKPVRFYGLLNVITGWKKREHELERMAYFDELTGHLNRACLREALDEVLKSCRDENTSAAYMLVNIDRLSMLNDAYGFAIADTVIADIGKRMEDCTRFGDIIGRVGGNQFGLVLVGAADVELRKAAEQILSSARRREVATEAGPLAVTLSLGGVLLPKDAVNSREAIGRAEEALSSKTAGAGRLCVAPRLAQS